MYKYTEQQIVFLIEKHIEHGPAWAKITNAFNKNFKTDKSENALRIAHSRYSSLYDMSEDEAYVKTLRATRSTRKTNSQLRKDNDKLLEAMSQQEDILEGIKEIVASKKFPKIAVDKPKRDATKKKMIKELLLSDLHYGKLTPDFNSVVARKRMAYLTDIFIREVQDSQKIFDVDKLIIFLGGDIIESATMHGLESATGSEFGNAEQVQLAITSLFEDLLVPLAKLGVPITIPCIPGNHDRTHKEKTYNKIGRNYLSWVIYNTLQQLCQVAKLNHVTFEIAEESYVILDVYGDRILYHHGDLANRGVGQSRLKNFRRDVEDQVGFKIDGSRSGHTHEYVVYGRGVDIVNGCLCGQDSYALNMGYSTEASQTINSYVKSKSRRTQFYNSFAPSLEVK